LSEPKNSELRGTVVTQIWSQASSPKMAPFMRRSGPTIWARVTLAKTIFAAACEHFSTGSLTASSKNLKVVVAGDIGTFEWDFVTTKADGATERIAGCDLLKFVGDEVAVKNAFRKQRI
jgi:hypothetical protein